jgi:hypothetical protein
MPVDTSDPNVREFLARMKQQELDKGPYHVGFGYEKDLDWYQLDQIRQSEKGNNNVLGN